MADDLLDCDLILKGGVTSGVVYPRAISNIGKRYRLHGIGGTSAGAIAAAFAAAAEYRRQSGGGFEGFEAVEESGKFLASGDNMKNLFAPSQKMRSLYDFVMGLNAPWPKWRLARLFVALGEGYGSVALGSAAAVLVVAAVLGVQDLGSWAAWCLVLLVALIVGIGAAVAMLVRDVTRTLPAEDWGMCPGIRPGGGTNGGAPLVFGDWIHASIQTIAGRGADDPPLTVGELEKHEVQLAAMTTDLTSRRPYQLPLEEEHYFCPEELRRILPAAIVAHLVAKGRKYDGPNACRQGDMYRLPAREDFPAFLVVRMSLSFPGLISSVPLYRRDTDVAPDKVRMVRCLFTDGGITSNFPIHFFDSILPGRPTFGFALGETDVHAGDAAADRLRLPIGAAVDLALPSQPTNGLADFGWAVLGTAKDWQDVLQSRLPGYKERTIHILLKPAEGGLNMKMDGEVIERLLGYGGAAADRLMAEFDFNEHRKLRAEVALPKVSDLLDQVRTKFGQKPLPGTPTYVDLLSQPTRAQFLDCVAPDWSEKVLLPFAERLVGTTDPKINPGVCFNRIPAKVLLRALSGRPL